MAAEVRNFSPSIPAGTPIAAPVVVNMTMPPRVVTHVRVRTPPGPRGQVGWAIGVNGVPVIPTNTGGWIVADDEIHEWDVHDQPTSGAWQLIGYNTGSQPHAIYVTFDLELVGQVGGRPVTAPLDVSA